MDIWVVGTSNQLYLRRSKTGTNYPKKITQLLTKLHSLWQFHFIITILFVLTLVSDRVVSTKKRYSSFLRKVFVFQKICFKAKVLKKFETFTDCHIKTCRSLKRRAILKIPSTVFRRTYALPVGFKMKTLRNSVFVC